MNQGNLRLFTIKKSGSLLAVLVFVVVMQLVPWEQLKGHPFTDLENYRERFLYQEAIFSEKEHEGLIDYISGEALWHYGMYKIVRELGVDIDLVFTGITTICLGTFGGFIVAKHGPFSLLLLCSPLMVQFAFEQVRMALAYSLLLIAYALPNRKLSVVLCVPAILIHTAMLIFIAIVFAIGFVRRYANSRIITITALCFFGLAVSIAIGPMREVILDLVGDRRAYVVDVSSSFLYSAYWLLLLGLMLSQRTEYFRNDVNCYSIVVLSVIVANLFTGGYSTRILSVGLPATMSSLLSMEALTRSIGLCFLSAYMVLQWMYWLGLRV